MRGEIKRLQKELGITSIFVTHDQIEALTMAGRVALMQNGRAQGLRHTRGPVRAGRANRFVAEFIGNPPMNFLPAELTRRDEALVVAADGLSLETHPATAERLPGNGTIRPVTLRSSARAPQARGGQGDATGEVLLIEPMGREQIVDVHSASGCSRCWSRSAPPARPGPRRPPLRP